MAVAVRRLLAAALVVAQAACGDRQDASPAAGSPTGAGTPSAASVPASRAAPSAGRAPCPRTGHWTECIAFAYLGRAGLAPQRGGSVEGLPRLGVTPHAYTVGTGRVAVYIFADAAARERAAGSLDPQQFVAPSAALTARGEVTTIQDDNLLALLYTRREQQRERVSDVFASGAPQP
ncbi:MAG: hypothetical protein JWL60_2272 [Gemmatimonadetes bacterium]|jgi:hypothetical protein|nr:hypothetical protein [Gemmatimonadota bacterium]